MLFLLGGKCGFTASTMQLQYCVLHEPPSVVARSALCTSATLRYYTNHTPSTRKSKSNDLGFSFGWDRWICCINDAVAILCIARTTVRCWRLSFVARAPALRYYTNHTPSTKNDCNFDTKLQSFLTKSVFVGINSLRGWNHFVMKSR